MAIQAAESPLETYTQNGYANSALADERKDPIIEILSAFYAIPKEYHADLFNSIQSAAESNDLRRLLDTISDWAATAQLYADPNLAADLTEAIGNRKEAADWLTG